MNIICLEYPQSERAFVVVLYIQLLNIKLWDRSFDTYADIGNCTVKDTSLPNQLSVYCLTWKARLCSRVFEILPILRD